MTRHASAWIGGLALLAAACGGGGADRATEGSMAPAGRAAGGAPERGGAGAATPAATAGSEPGRAPAVAGMDDVVLLYLKESDRLASDRFEPAEAAALARATAAVKAEPEPAWLGPLRDTSAAYAAAGGIDAARQAFGKLSEVLIGYVRAHETAVATHLVHCPMAPEGIEGSWLQAGDEVRNPWYGAGMLACGVKKW